MSKIETNKIDSISGTSTLKIGETNATTLDFDTGLTSITNIPWQLTNTPAFYVERTANQSIANNTDVKIQFTNRVYDTDSAYDISTNYRFTVPTGKAGKYHFSYGMYLEGQTDNRYAAMRLKVNGTNDNHSYIQDTEAGSSGNIPSGSVTLDLSAGDYVELST